MGEEVNTQQANPEAQANKTQPVDAAQSAVSPEAQQMAAIINKDGADPDKALAEIAGAKPEQQTELGFNPAEAWNVDSIAIYNMDNEQKKALLVNVPDHLKATVEGRLNTIAGDINWRRRMVEVPKVGAEAFKAQGEVLSANIMEKMDVRNPRNIGEMNEADYAVLDILQKQMGAQLAGEDPDTGAREFKTKSPGLEILAFQNDAGGKNINKLTTVRVLMKNPADSSSSFPSKMEPSARISIPGRAVPPPRAA